MKLDEALKTAFDELRMQMLGLQVLFGFQFQGLFQDGFAELDVAGRRADAAGLGLLLAAAAIIIAAASQHRLIEQGEATVRIYRTVARHGRLALLPIAAALGCTLYVPLERAARPWALAPALAGTLLALCAWYALPGVLRRHHAKGDDPVKDSATPLGTKIEQMLTEARVILPGAQALLGFQLVVMMARSFDRLPTPLQFVHMAALLALSLAVILLIAPTAVHRIGFEGREDPRVHSIGSVLITAGLVPLALALACDLALAAWKLFEAEAAAITFGIAGFLVLMASWYAWPLLLRRRHA